MSDIGTRLRRYWLLFFRFLQRYGPALFILFASAVIGWTVASSVSDYTHGGWEIHLIERGIGLNLHLHHWYYGIPFGLIAFLLIELNASASIFLFGLGQTLAAHSFINEKGIPSFIEGGETWHLSPEIYFPIVTALSLLYAFFLVRREEWLARAREREEIAISYFCPKTETIEVLNRIDAWALKHFDTSRLHQDTSTQIVYGEWKALDRPIAEWQLHYVASPFDELLNLIVIRIEHIPLQGRQGQLDDWLIELDAALAPHVHPVVSGAGKAAQVLGVQAK